MRRAVALLPVRYREVVAPALDEGLSPDDIARRLARNPSTVRTQLARGLERLRRVLPVTGAVAVASSAANAAAVARVRAVVLRGHEGVAVASAGLSVVALAVWIVGVGVGVSAWWMMARAGAGAGTAGRKEPVLASASSPAPAGVTEQEQQASARLVAEPAPRAPVDEQANTPLSTSRITLVDVAGVCIEHATGAPLADCEVWLHGFRANEVAALYFGEGAWRDPPPVRTGADGRFVHRVEPTAARQYTVETKHPGHVPCRAWFTGDAARGGTLDLGELRVERGHELAGAVVDPQGRGLAGIALTLWFTNPRRGPFADSTPAHFVSDHLGRWAARKNGLVPAHTFAHRPWNIEGM